MSTLNTLLLKSIKKYSNKVFYKSLDDASEILFNDLLSLTYPWLLFFKEKNIQKGDCIAFTLDLSESNIGLLLTIFCFGYVGVPLYPETTQSTSDYIVNETNAKFLIFDNAIPLRFSPDKIQSKNFNTFELQSINLKYSHNDDVNLANFDINPTDKAAIIFSSGSTGKPKGIILSHGNLYLGAEIVSKYLSINSNDHIFSTLRPNFDYGLNQIWVSLLKGSKLTGFNMRKPYEFFNKVSLLKPTIIPLMPAIINILMQGPMLRLSKEYTNKSVRLICSSGGRLFHNNLTWLENTFSNAWICPMYGQTEAFRSTYVPKKDYYKKKDSIGIAIPQTELLVVDAEDNILESDQVGELIHLGGCISDGYLGLDQLNRKKFKPLKSRPNQKCVRTGDLVYKDVDGYIYFVGRNDEMIKSYGIRVSPTEVEEIANQLSYIVNSIAFGTDLSLKEQRINLAIVVNHQFDNESFKEDLIEKFPNHLRPSCYGIFKEFPTTGNGGKVNNSLVKEMFNNGMIDTFFI